MGAKLACGLEILAAKVVEAHTEEHVQDQDPDADAAASHSGAPFDSDPRWRRYRARLSAVGYFKENIPGASGCLEGKKRVVALGPKISPFDKFRT